MIRSVLVCTDGSPHSKVALQYARDWARKMRLRVRVLFVEDLRLTQGPLVTGYYGPVGMAPSPAYPAFYDELVKTLKEQGQQALTQARDVFADSDVEVDYVAREGIVHKIILEEARTVDLLCMGKQGEHGEWEEDEIGSTVQKILRHSQRPVLVTPEEFIETSKLLVAYDNSEPANKALRLGLGLASDEGWSAVIATVVEDEDDRERFERMQAEAKQLAAGYSDVETELVLLEGERDECLLIDYAAMHGCDLLVMGAYGESRLRELLLGSTTGAVVLRSNLPVLLLR